METKCKNCKYFESRDVTTPFRIGNAPAVTKKVERCRRYPPTGLGNGSDFPSAKPNEWCGEFIPKGDAGFDLMATSKAAGDAIISGNQGPDLTNSEGQPNITPEHVKVIEEHAKPKGKPGRKSKNATV